MARKQFHCMGGLVVATALASSAAAQTQPNLIFILTDDMGTESIEGTYWGNEMGCIAPTLAALADQGVSFTSCRVNPNCSPTRAALMTGRSALDTGVNGVLGRYAGADECDHSDLTGTVAQRVSASSSDFDGLVGGHAGGLSQGGHSASRDLNST